MPRFDGYQIVKATYHFMKGHKEQVLFGVYQIKDGRPVVERPVIKPQENLEAVMKELEKPHWSTTPWIDGVLEYSDQKIYLPDPDEAKKVLEEKSRRGFHF